MKDPIVFEDDVTIGDKYAPAMEINDPDAAARYFEACVEHCMRFGNDREQAESIERSNLGYYAGYYDTETRERVERLFNCSHPIFGSVAQYGSPGPETAFEIGRLIGEAGAES